MLRDAASCGNTSLSTRAWSEVREARRTGIAGGRGARRSPWRCGCPRTACRSWRRCPGSSRPSPRPRSPASSTEGRTCCAGCTARASGSYAAVTTTTAPLPCVSRRPAETDHTLGGAGTRAVLCGVLNLGCLRCESRAFLRQASLGSEIRYRRGPKPCAAVLLWEVALGSLPHSGVHVCSALSYNAAACELRGVQP